MGRNPETQGVRSPPEQRAELFREGPGCKRPRHSRCTLHAIMAATSAASSAARTVDIIGAASPPVLPHTLTHTAAHAPTPTDTHTHTRADDDAHAATAAGLRALEPTCAMSLDDIARYSRPMLVRGFGAPAQERLLRLRVCVVGVGGLGAPTVMYLAAAGVGTITIVDDDVVDVSNLHRQVIHTPAGAAARLSKVASAANWVRSMNPRVDVIPLHTRFDAELADAIVPGHDVVVDASDNPRTRYLASDACVQHQVPLVSAAAVGTCAQMSVYGWAGGPCYRCVHPEAPPAETITSCADGGVLGPLVGAVGCLQALEVLKIAALTARPLSSDAGQPAPAAVAPRAATAASSAELPANGTAAQPPSVDTASHTSTTRSCPPGPPSSADGVELLSGRMLVLDGADMRVRVMKLRGRLPTCAACGDDEHRTIRSARDSAAWCDTHGLVAAEVCAVPQRDGASDQLSDSATPGIPSLPVEKLAEARTAAVPNDLVLDVRDKWQYDICRLRNSINIPLRDIRLDTASAIQRLGVQSGDDTRRVLVLCRRGVDSVDATRILRAAGLNAYNVEGGLVQYAQRVDRSFPLY